MLFQDKLSDIIDVLQRGGIILYPTDTIWGIGCDATNEAAVARVAQLKQRDPSKSGFVVLVDSLDMLQKHVAHIHPRIETLLAFHSRPLTVIYDEGINLAPNALAPDGSVAIRIAQDNFCRVLIHELGRPIISTSANVSNEAFPSHFGAISSAIIQGVDYVVRYRQEDHNVGEPSVIVRLSSDEELDFIRE